jgi:hypothetical protein
VIWCRNLKEISGKRTLEKDQQQKQQQQKMKIFNTVKGALISGY